MGVSSPQLDVPERGFSYHHDAKLDMRMDQTQSLSAYEVVNEWPYEALVKIFYRYGEEKFSKQIARRIEANREKQPIETTLELVEVIKEGIPAKARRKVGILLRVFKQFELQLMTNYLHLKIQLNKQLN